MMGSGKSHWAGKLGHHFGIPAYDLDKLIETEAGKTIREIFEQEGEPTFRKMEADMLMKTSRQEQFILATGGGTPCFFSNMELMKNNGMVLWLNPSTGELVKRLKKGIDTRPVLEGIQSPDALKMHLQKLLELRYQWYLQADIHLNEDLPSFNEIVQKINLFEPLQP